MKDIRVKLGKRSYRIIIGSGILADLGYILKQSRAGKDAIVITNPRIWSLYGRRLEKSLRSEGIGVSCEKIPASESSKSNRQAESLINKLRDAKLI